MKIRNLHTFALVSVSAIGASNAAITFNSATESPSGNPHSGTISANSTDLLTGLSPSSSGLFNGADATGIDHLTDGNINTLTGGGANGDDRTRLGSGDFLVYDLDVTTNTLGYDLTSIASYTYWGDARADQGYTVSHGCPVHLRIGI